MTDKIRAFTMPKWGIEMEEGVVREWKFDEGQFVKEGDVLTVIETDKIANDVELEYSGWLRRRIAIAGDAYKVGALIAVFADEDIPDAEVDAFVSAFRAADAGFSSGDDAPSTSTSVASAPPAATPSPANVPDGLSISPKALELAQSLGVDLSGVAGSGRKGRISLQDVEQAAKSQGLDPDSSGRERDNPHRVIKLSSMRRTIAKRLTEATQTIPHFYLRTDVLMDRLLADRASRKEKGQAPSVNDYLIKACAEALMDVPAVNVHFMGEEIRQFQHADISVAVAVPGGLMTPVVRMADTKSLEDIASEMKDLAARARTEKLAQHEYQGGTISLSNLGMYGVTSFDAVVNPPMGAILAAGSIEERAVRGGFSSIMTVTMSCDHRAVDGALGGEFLRALKKGLESLSFV